MINSKFEAHEALRSLVGYRSKQFAACRAKGISIKREATDAMNAINDLLIYSQRATDYEMMVYVDHFYHHIIELLFWGVRRLRITPDLYEYAKACRKRNTRLCTA